MWLVIWQSVRKSITQCKRLTIVSENRKTGETVTMRPKIWEIHIRDTVSSAALKVRLQLNELNQPTFTIEHPPKMAYQTIKRNSRDIPVCDKTMPMYEKKGETEKFYGSKTLRTRIAGFAGFTFANEVISIFIKDTPFGEEL